MHRYLSRTSNFSAVGFSRADLKICAGFCKGGTKVCDEVFCSPSTMAYDPITTSPHRSSKRMDFAVAFSCAQG